jgi:hypothetical protein
MNKPKYRQKIKVSLPNFSSILARGCASIGEGLYS